MPKPPVADTAKRALWLLTTAVGLVAFAGAVVYLLGGARNIAVGGPATFGGTAFYVAVPASEVGFLVGLAIATASYRRNVWSVLRNATFATWTFVIVDLLLSFHGI